MGWHSLVLRDTPPPVFNAPVIPVSALLGSARRLIERSIPLTWISGEISNSMRASSGHCYFVLKDAQAQVRCVMFRSRAQGLTFALKDGLQVEIRAQATLYEARGEFQLTVDSMRLAGAGVLYERFLKLKATLEARGWFEAARKRELPGFPRVIGIVTSPRAAALRDVLSTLRARSPHVRAIVYPCSVQGNFAGADIASAIRTANARTPVDHVDVLILCRGGGSIEDLWSFNEEIVARAIFQSEIPVISGVGHETDFTISDFVADVRAPTPTGAAQMAAPATLELANDLRNRLSRLQRAMHQRGERDMQRVDYAGRRLQHPAARLAAQRTKLADLARRLDHRFRVLQDARARSLDAMRARLIQDVRTEWPQAKRLEAVGTRLTRGWREMTHRQDLALGRAAVSLQHLNPEAVLERGYAIVTRGDSSIVQDSSTLATGDALALRFARGAAQVVVTSKTDD